MPLSVHLLAVRASSVLAVAQRLLPGVLHLAESIELDGPADDPSVHMSCRQSDWRYWRSSQMRSQTARRMLAQAAAAAAAMQAATRKRARHAVKVSPPLVVASCQSVNGWRISCRAWRVAFLNKECHEH